MRSILYFLLGFAVQFVLWLPAYANYCPDGQSSVPTGASGSGTVKWIPDWQESPYTGSTCTSSFNPGTVFQTKGETPDGFIIYEQRTYQPTGVLASNYGDCIIEYSWVRYVCADCDTCTNGIQDGDETGIDCGGSTGVECVTSCPDGYALKDGVCTQYNNFGDEIIWYKDLTTYDPIYHSPDYVVDPTTEPWQPSTNESGMVPIDPSLFVTQEKNILTGDIIVRDSEGNITGALIIGDSQTTTNSDGTTTTTTNITEHSTSGVVSEKTVTETKDASGNVIDKKETVTGTPHSVSLYASGKGSNDGVTGDQHAAGVATLVGAIEGKGVTFTAPTESGEPGEFETIDEAEYDWRAGVDTFVEANDEMSWKTYFEGSGITTTGAVCDITGDVTIGSKTVPVSLSLCSFESVFQTLGYLFVTLTQLSALFIVFRGLD